MTDQARPDQSPPGVARSRKAAERAVDPVAGVGVERFEDVGEARLFPFSIVREGSNRWYFDVMFEGSNPIDIPKSYRTPGLALDAVIEWARQRGLTVPLAGQEFTLRKENR